MAITSKDLPTNTIAEKSLDTPDLSFLEKTEGKVSDIGINEIPLKSNNEDVNENVTEQSVFETKNLDEQQQDYLELASIFKIKPKIKKEDIKPKGETLDEIKENHKRILNKIDDDTDFEIDKGSGTITFREFSENEIKDVNDILNKFGIGELSEQKKNTSMKFIFKELDKDNNGMYNPGSFSDAVNTIFQDQLIKAKGGQVKIEDVMTQAASMGRMDVYLKILNSKPGDSLPLEVMVRGMMETKILYKKLSSIAEKGKRGETTEIERQEFYKLLVLYGQIYAKTAGDLSGAARKMRVSQEITKEQPDLAVNLQGVEDITRYLEDNYGAKIKDADDFKNLATHFLELREDQVTKFAKDGLASKFANGWVEVWVNSRLMSPITHIVNVTGNLGFNLLRVFEYGTAATINKIPFLSSPDGVMFNEVFDMIRGTLYGAQIGMVNAAEGFKTGAAITKLDLPPRKAITKDVLPDRYKNSAIGTMLEYFGTAVRLPGRMLVAEDEFFKGVLFNMELERIATKRYNKVLQNGGSIEEAQAIRVKTLADPDRMTREEVKASMLEGTFQGELPPGLFKSAQTYMNEPAVKLFVPFYKTVMNIFFESSKRNPMLAGFMPSVRRDLMGKNGPAKKQLAMAKLMTGSTLMFSFANFAYGAGDGTGNYIITGRAPGNKAERQAFFRAGYQPYSIGVKQEDGTFKFTSYARFDPISSLLAISADIGYLMSRPDQYGNANSMDQSIELFQHAITAIFPYLGEQPFVTGVSEIGKIFNSPGSDTDNKIVNGFGLALQKVTEGSVGIVLNPTGTFGNYLERMQDPKVYDYRIQEDQATMFREMFDGDVPYPIRSFYEAYNKILKQSPFFNPDLPPRLNLWGEQMLGPEQGVFSPLKITKIKGYKRVDDWLQTFGLGMSMPKNKIDGIAMSAEQYNALIMFMNEDNDNNGISDMLQEMDAKFDDTEFQMLPLGEQLGDLNAIKSKYFKNAKKKLYAADPALKNSVDNLAERIKIQGKK